MIATIIGFIGVAGLIGLALLQRSFWIGLMAVFILMNCWRGWVVSRAMMRLAKSPHRDGFACPLCGEAPPIGAYWRCAKCGTGFDTFETAATCPQCGEHFGVTRCAGCGQSSPMSNSRSASVLFQDN